MKKFLSFLVISLFVFLPFTVVEANEIVEPFDCTTQDSEGYITCTVNYIIDSNAPMDNLTVTLTEYNGAEIDSVDRVSNSEWIISTQNTVDTVWTIVLTSGMEVSGEQSLLTFRYRGSGHDDCRIGVGIGNDNKDVDTTPTDTPTDNVQTGSTLPYIALGAIALIAVGAYFTTKNKSKMYKI